MACLAFSGRSGDADPFSGYTSNTNTTANADPITVTATGITATNGDDLCWISCPDVTTTGAGNGHTAPTNFTERCDLEPVGASQLTNLGVATRDAVSAGATGNVSGTFNVTATGAGWISFLVGIKAAPSATYVSLTDVESSGSISAISLASIAVQQGDLIFVAPSWEDNSARTVSSVTDNAAGGSNTYTQRASARNSTSAYETNVWLYCGIAKASETLTISANLSGSLTANFYGMVVVVARPPSGKVFSYDNAAGAAATATGTSAATGSFSASGGAGFAFCHIRDYNGATWTPGSGWTQPALENSSRLIEYDVLTNETTLNGNGTISAGTWWTAVAAAYKLGDPPPAGAITLMGQAVM